MRPSRRTKARGSSNPPKGFKPAGVVRYARGTARPQFAKRGAIKGKKRSGLIYEDKVQEFLTDLYCEDLLQYLPSVWIEFEDGRGKTRVCQPDGLLLDARRGRLTIVEIKTTHTHLAWWQVRALYQPVLRKIFPDDIWPHLQGLEICKRYEPVEFPERFHFLGEPHQVPANSFGVMKLKL